MGPESATRTCTTSVYVRRGLRGRFGFDSLVCLVTRRVFTLPSCPKAYGSYVGPSHPVGDESAVVVYFRGASIVHHFCGRALAGMNRG